MKNVKFQKKKANTQKNGDKRVEESEMDLLNLLYESNFIHSDIETEKID